VILDLGSGYGAMQPYIHDRIGTQTIYQLEPSLQMLKRDIHLDSNYKIKPIRIRSSEERLPFAPKSLDLVVSCMSLHWVNDLPGTFKQVKECLKPDGVFMGAMFGGETLQELRSSLIMAEQEREGGISSHISPFTTLPDVGNLLSGAGFSLTTVDQELFTVNYADAFILMHDLRGMAENNATILRRKYVSK